MKRIAIYPGSFDPPTNGHLDLIERGAKIFDELIVAILRNVEKEPLFSLEERRTMLEQMTRHCPNVRVDTFSGLTVEYAVSQGAEAVLRGIRAISDYEYELQMALMNRKLEPRLETVFMMPAEAYSYLSSRLVKEIARLGGAISGLVPPQVEQRLQQKLAEQDGDQRAIASTGSQDMDEGAVRRSNHTEPRPPKRATTNSQARRQSARSGKHK